MKNNFASEWPGYIKDYCVINLTNSFIIVIGLIIQTITKAFVFSADCSSSNNSANKNQGTLESGLV